MERSDSLLIEREGELGAVDAALDAAERREGRIVFVEGHPGIGKTELLEAARGRADERGTAILWALASDLERAHSFGVVRQLFEAVVGTERDDLAVGAASLALPLFDARTPAGASPDEQVFSLLHGLFWLTANLAERGPVLVAVDDAHWSDRLSLRFLLYLAQRVTELPVAVLLAARPAEPGAPQDLLRQLKAHRATQVVRPAPLTPAGVQAVTTARLPGATQEFVDACLTVTEGNPYLLCELLADLADRGVEPTAENACEVGRLAPAAVLDQALVRLARLPVAASALARAVAVLGDDATVDRAATLAGVGLDVAAPAADALVAAELFGAGEPPGVRPSAAALGDLRRPPARGGAPRRIGGRPACSTTREHGRRRSRPTSSSRRRPATSGRSTGCAAPRRVRWPPAPRSPPPVTWSARSPSRRSRRHAPTCWSSWARPRP